jgi:hypothetical protein
MPITINQYCRINQNGSININTDPAFGGVIPPLSTNLLIYCIAGGSINSVTIGGGPSYVIKEGSFPVDSTILLQAHQFGGTSISFGDFTQSGVAIKVNGVQLFGICGVTDNGPFNYTFTENDLIEVFGQDCGG